MGATAKISFIGFIIIAILLGRELNNFFKTPVVNIEDTWWGTDESPKYDTSIKPFKISVSDKVLEDLRYRLNSHRTFTPPLENIQQQYGINTKLLQEVVDFWYNKYDWREREKFLNKYPQFTTNIQGLNIHFIHVKPQRTSSNVKVLPLMMLHGWPGSIREFYSVIPMLTELNNENKKFGYVFELVIPSLPGYGFSQPSVRPGLGATQIAVVFKNLMLRLGYDKFYVQGGDWGSVIASDMAAMFPNHVLGVHSTMCIGTTPLGALKYLLGSLYPPLIVKEEYQKRMYPLLEHVSLYILESGYFHIQATKPDTIGVALNDSPVGLAAYILEKFSTGTNIQFKERLDGGLKLKFTYTDLLDNVMIYWITNSITTSMRLYSEAFSETQISLKMNSIPVTVPYGCAKFPGEIGYMPDEILSHRFKNLVYSSHFEEGGHFAAFEMPKELAGDVWKAISKMEGLRASENILEK